MSEDNPSVVFATEYGDITVALFAEQAPLTVTNFLRYVSEQRFSPCSFFRIVNDANQEIHAEQNPAELVNINIVQGGLKTGSPLLLENIPHETTLQTGILHLDGTLSMARFEPGSANGSFFFCIGDQPELDYGGKRYRDGLGFAAFGAIIHGRDILQTIFLQAESREDLSREIAIYQIRFD